MGRHPGPECWTFPQAPPSSDRTRTSSYMTLSLFPRARTATFTKSLKEAFVPGAAPVIRSDVIVPDLRQVECTSANIEISVQNNNFGPGVVVSGLGAHGASDKGTTTAHMLLSVIALVPVQSYNQMSISILEAWHSTPEMI